MRKACWIIAGEASLWQFQDRRDQNFDPPTNQNANAWKIDYRKYHDLWIADNSMDGVFVNVSA